MKKSLSIMIGSFFSLKGALSSSIGSILSLLFTFIILNNLENHNIKIFFAIFVLIVIIVLYIEFFNVSKKYKYFGREWWYLILYIALGFVSGLMLLNWIGVAKDYYIMLLGIYTFAFLFFISSIMFLFVLINNKDSLLKEETDSRCLTILILIIIWLLYFLSITFMWLVVKITYISFQNSDVKEIKNTFSVFEWVYYNSDWKLLDKRIDQLTNDIILWNTPKFKNETYFTDIYTSAIDSSKLLQTYAWSEDVKLLFSWKIEKINLRVWDKDLKTWWVAFLSWYYAQDGTSLIGKILQTIPTYTSDRYNFETINSSFNKLDTLQQQIIDDNLLSGLLSNQKLKTAIDFYQDYYLYYLKKQRIISIYIRNMYQLIFGWIIIAWLRWLISESLSYMKNDQEKIYLLKERDLLKKERNLLKKERNNLSKKRKNNRKKKK